MLFKIGLYEYGDNEDNVFDVFEKEFDSLEDCELFIAENNFYSCADCAPQMIRLN